MAIWKVSLSMEEGFAVCIHADTHELARQDVNRIMEDALGMPMIIEAQDGSKVRKIKTFHREWCITDIEKLT